MWPQIQSLQDQLENGPKAQLARMQQENSILRDALNQATSQAESRYCTQYPYIAILFDIVDVAEMTLGAQTRDVGSNPVDAVV